MSPASTDGAVPSSYLRLPASSLASAVLELAELYQVYAQDMAEGTRTVVTFEDALRFHRLLDVAREHTQAPLA